MMDRRQFVTTSVALGAGTVGLTGARTAAAQVARPGFEPVEVPIRPDVPAGEIHVMPNAFMLYWTMPGARAIRYMIRVGRPGLYEAGEYFVGAKKKWPSWTPTRAMMERNPDYRQWEDGMPGGPDNPLGARALYLFQLGRGDTFLRIHGTNAPGTIGRAVSNGCAGLINEQAIDLYERVPMGTRVVLHPQAI